MTPGWRRSRDGGRPRGTIGLGVEVALRKQAIARDASAFRASRLNAIIEDEVQRGRLTLDGELVRPTRT